MRLKASRWLKATILLSFIAFLAILTFAWRYVHGGTIGEAFWGWQWESRSSPANLILLGVPFQVGLLWFTFASKSKLVTDDDKKLVLLMFAGAVAGYLILAVRHLFAI